MPLKEPQIVNPSDHETDSLAHPQHASDARLRRASRRGASKPDLARGLTRTIVLGAVVVAVAVIWLGRQYGVEPAETLAFLGNSLVFVLVLIGLAGATAGLLILLRRLRNRR